MEALIVIGLFLVFNVLFLVAIWRTLRRRYPRPPADTLDLIPPEKSRGRDAQWWLRYPLRALIAAAAFFALLGLVDDTLAADVDPKAVRIVLNTGDCPPPTEEALPILIFTVHIDPGNGKPQTSCARVMKRKYLITRRPKPTQTSSTKE